MLGTRLRFERLRKELTKEELARRAGISAYYITKIEDEKSIPGTAILERIAKALQINFNQLLSKALPQPDAILIDGKLGSTFIHATISNQTKKLRPGVLYSPGTERRENLEEELTDGLKRAKLNLSPDTLIYAARALSGILKREKIQGLIGTCPDTVLLVGVVCAVFQEMKLGKIVPGILFIKPDGSPEKVEYGGLKGLVTGLLCEALPESADIFHMLELMKKADCQEIKVVSIFDSVPEETKAKTRQTGVPIIKVFSKLETLFGPEVM